MYIKNKISKLLIIINYKVQLNVAFTFFARSFESEQCNLWKKLASKCEHVDYVYFFQGMLPTPENIMVTCERVQTFWPQAAEQQAAEQQAVVFQFQAKKIVVGITYHYLSLTNR